MTYFVRLSLDLFYETSFWLNFPDFQIHFLCTEICMKTRNPKWLTYTMKDIKHRRDKVFRWAKSCLFDQPTRNLSRSIKSTKLTLSEAVNANPKRLSILVNKRRSQAFSLHFSLSQAQNSHLSCTDTGRKACMCDLCHSYRDHDRGEARSKGTCSRLHLRTWEYSQPRTIGKVALSQWFFF